MTRAHDRAARYELGAELWRRFVRRHWGRRPAVLRTPFAEPIASPAEVFAAMTAAARRVRHRDRELALAIDGARVGTEIDRWLPKRSDRSLDGLATRISRELPGSTFALDVLGIQVELGWAVWQRVRHFLRGLYSIVGVAATRAEIDLFAGSYRRTPTGIHQDSAHVFCFVIEGGKRMHLWPRTAFSSRGSRWYGFGADARARARSIRIDGEPGDVLYWPPSHWHVGESRGGVASSLSLALYPGASLSERACRLVELEAARELGKHDLLEDLPLSIDRLNPPPARALRAIARASADVGPALLRDHMERVTAYGFEDIPPAPAKGSLGSHIASADPAFPILYRAVGKSAIVAANGSSVSVPRSAALRSLIDRLNAGEVVSGRLERLRPMLRFLRQVGAIEPRHDGQRASRER